MPLHRFFIESDLINNNQIFLPEETSHQISKVLRLKEHDQIIILDNTGKEYLCTLTKIDKKHSEARIAKTEINQNEPELKVHLYQSLITRDNFELVLQKSVELGVTEITPIQTERTQFNISWATEKLDRWQKIIREAAEQSKRGKLPILHDPLNFESAIKEAIENGETLVAWEKEQSQQNKPHSFLNSKFKILNLIIGPEGGFTDNEIEFAKKQKAKPISLGKRILRSETASIVTLAKILI